MKKHLLSSRVSGRPAVVAANLLSLALPFTCTLTCPVTCFGSELPHSAAAAGTVPDSFSATAYADAPMHLLVGRSVSISSAKRLTRVYVTNPGVLYAYTASPNQVLVTSKEPGVSSLMVWDEAGGSQTYLFSSDLAVEALRSSLKAALPGEDLHVEADGGRVLLTGTVSGKDKYALAEKLAGQYAKDVSNGIVVNSAKLKQVRLRVRIVEVDRTKLEQLGFNLFNTGSTTLGQSTTSQFPSTITASTGSSSSTSSGTSLNAGGQTISVSNPLNFLLYSADLNIGAVIQDLESRQVLQILAEPTITTLSGEKANFLAGGEFPFPVVQGSTGGLTSISIQFRPYGVKLDFLPEVNADGSIQLHVAPEVSALDYTNAVQINGYTIPAISSRRADTQVVLKDKQSFAISGLLDQRTTDQLSRTPGIASIPFIGTFFKSKNVNHSTSELMVLVTPEIVDPQADAAKADEPKLAIPMLDRPTFDDKLPKPKAAR